MNRISVMADSFRLGVLGGIAQAKALGAGAVQISVGPRNSITQTWTPSFRAEVKQALTAHSISVSAMCADLGGHGFQVPEEIDWRVEETRLMMDLALYLGCNILTSHIGVIPEDSSHPRYSIMLSALTRLSHYAQAANCRIAIETGPERPEVLKAFIEKIPGNSIGVNYDPANLVMVPKNVDPVQGVYTLKDHIFHTHVKDGKQLQYIGPEAIYGFFAEGGIEDLRMEDYFLETALGEGDVDFPNWIKALKDIGYQGYFTIEREVGDNPTADIQKAVDFLKAHL